MINPSEWMDPDRYAEWRQRSEQNERLRQALTREMARALSSEGLRHGALYHQGYYAGMYEVLRRLTAAMHINDATWRLKAPIHINDATWRLKAPIHGGCVETEAGPDPGGGLMND